MASASSCAVPARPSSGTVEKNCWSVMPIAAVMVLRTSSPPGVMIGPGDTMVLFSDGVTEAMDPDEQLFGVPRLKKILTGQPECPLEDLQKCVLEAVENFTRGARQADDVTLLILRYRATAAKELTDTDVPASASAASSASA